MRWKFACAWTTVAPVRPAIRRRARPRGRSAALLVALLVLALVAAGGGGARAGRGVVADARPPFARAVVVVFENKDFNRVIGSPEAPTFSRLARRYALLADYRGVSHPSLPNYLALVSGSTHGITSDCTTCRVTGPNLADTLERAGRTWKTYAEGLPRAGFTGPWAGRYAKKHDPFVYFDDIATSPGRLRRIVPLTQFGRDLAANRLPDFSLVVPDLCHDMHDCSVATGDAWLASFLRPLLRSDALGRGVVFVVFDEGTGAEGGGGHVPALALGPLVRPGSRVTSPLDHYGLLRTIEDAWGLPRLGRSRTARPVAGLWR